MNCAEKSIKLHNDRSSEYVVKYTKLQKMVFKVLKVIKTLGLKNS